MDSVPDRIVKEIVMRAPLARVWAAVGDAREFGEWFKIALDGPFVAGQTVRGKILEPGYEHLTAELAVERVEPPHLLAFRWHPGEPAPDADLSAEPTTLVEFHLAEVAEGTKLTVVESGFSKIPADRRRAAFRSNEGGWAEQVERVKRHVGG
jgi:uncharacterized protein YndB with AHSA1/START domain